MASGSTGHRSVSHYRAVCQIQSRNMRAEWIKEQEWVTDRSPLLESAIKLMEAITHIKLYPFSTFVSNRERGLCGCAR